jgi:glutaredoxin
MGIITVVRLVLGEVIIFLNWLFKPKQVTRSSDQQQALDAKCKPLSLYQFRGCPFCVKVRRELFRLNLNLELRDIKKHPSYKDELLAGGGKTMVPCLRIESEDGVEWLYESSDINAYLQGIASHAN